jgi:hypothetical protein
MSLQYLSPVGPALQVKVDLARRPVSLEGLRIGVIDNSKPNADQLFEGISQWLGEEYGASLVRYYKKDSPAVPAVWEWYETLSKEVQVVLTGTGD